MLDQGVRRSGGPQTVTLSGVMKGPQDGLTAIAPYCKANMG